LLLISPPERKIKEISLDKTGKQNDVSGYGKGTGECQQRPFFEKEEDDRKKQISVKKSGYEVEVVVGTAKEYYVQDAVRIFFVEESGETKVNYG